MEVIITDQNIAEYLAQDKPLVIDFWATWCGPCRRMAPVVEALAEKYTDKVIVGKCDVDDNPDVTAQYGIRNIPTVLYIVGGQVVSKTVGAVPASEVESSIEALL
jgi:thioredoxin 1